jgi:hypothetical protein
MLAQTEFIKLTTEVENYNEYNEYGEDIYGE